HQRDQMEPPLELEGDATHWDFRQDDDNYYEQPGDLFRLMSDEQKEALFGNTARDMEGTEECIQIRHITNCYKADLAYGEGVAKAAGISMDKVKAALDEKLIILKTFLASNRQQRVIVSIFFF